MYNIPPDMYNTIVSIKKMITPGNSFILSSWNKYEKSKCECKVTKVTKLMILCIMCEHAI